jgi:hypothetical protein
MKKSLEKTKMTAIVAPSAEESAFRQLVLEHIQNALPSEEWARFREMSLQTRHSCDPLFDAKMGETPQALVDNATSEDGISLHEIVRPGWLKKSITIGAIQGAPVLYVQGHGVYAWSASPAQAPTLVLWLTHPAYPPGW